ncbi:MAG: hypothetical protein ACJ76A_08025 [Actinomycetota bacterium]|jgi:uncharacterized protein YaaN involved in tellurite resistance
MSELLMKGLSSTKRELEAGVADAEAELARTEEYCRKLEELIAVGKATLHAATQMPLPQTARPEPHGVTVVPELAKDNK